MNIIPYEPPMRQAALDLALRAWEPVFPQLKAAVPGFVYGAFYPEEWQTTNHTPWMWQCCKVRTVRKPRS